MLTTSLHNLKFVSFETFRDVLVLVFQIIALLYNPSLLVIGPPTVFAHRKPNSWHLRGANPSHYHPHVWLLVWCSNCGMFMSDITRQLYFTKGFGCHQGVPWCYNSLGSSNFPSNGHFFKFLPQSVPNSGIMTSDIIWGGQGLLFLRCSPRLFVISLMSRCCTLEGITLSVVCWSPRVL